MKAYVVHLDNMMKRGGAEQVCMNILEGLQTSYDVCLVTTSRPNIDKLNQYFSTDVDTVDLTIRSFYPDQFDRYLNKSRIAEDLINSSLRLFLNRFISNEDLVISSKNEVFNKIIEVQYIHYPVWLFRSGSDIVNEYTDLASESSFVQSSVTQDLYNKFCCRLHGFEKNDLPGTILTNSNWTGKIVSNGYGVETHTLYPPVNSTFEGLPYAQRKDGIISIGNVTPPKNILKNIEIIDHLRDEGYMYEYHIIGGYEDDSDYFKSVQQESDKRDYIKIHGRMERKNLVNYIETYKFGIHNHKYEHFGIGVAEMVSGGMIPFVPAGGGQQEVVGMQKSLIFESSKGCVQKIEEMIEKSNERQRVCDKLKRRSRQFTHEKFEQKLLSLV